MYKMGSTEKKGARLTDLEKGGNSQRRIAMEKIGKITRQRKCSPTRGKNKNPGKNQLIPSRGAR